MPPLPHVFDTLCVYRFASILLMLNYMKFWSIVDLSYKHQLDKSNKLVVSAYHFV